MDVKCKSHLVACKFLGLEEPLKTRLPFPCGSIVLFPPCFLIIVNHWDLSPIKLVLVGHEKDGLANEARERRGGGERRRRGREEEEERRRRGQRSRRQTASQPRQETNMQIEEKEQNEKHDNCVFNCVTERENETGNKSELI